MGNRKQEIERHLWCAVDLLGRMALSRRSRMHPRDARTLEDELFAVLEALNDLKEKAPSGVPDGRSSVDEKGAK